MFIAVVGVWRLLLGMQSITGFVLTLYDHLLFTDLNLLLGNAGMFCVGDASVSEFDWRRCLLQIFQYFTACLTAHVAAAKKEGR